MNFDPDQGNRFSIKETQDPIKEFSLKKDLQNFKEESRNSICIKARRVEHIKVTLEDFELVT
jgi:hypothetical protein